MSTLVSIWAFISIICLSLSAEGPKTLYISNGKLLACCFFAVCDSNFVTLELLICSLSATVRFPIGAFLSSIAECFCSYLVQIFILLLSGMTSNSLYSQVQKQSQGHVLILPSVQRKCKKTVSYFMEVRMGAGSQLINLLIYSKISFLFVNCKICSRALWVGGLWRFSCRNPWL